MSSFNTEISKHTIQGKTIRVYGCWDEVRDYENDVVPDFYDVYYDDGNIQHCMNEGDPFYEVPTLYELEELTKSYFE